ncbi:peroxidase 64-like isoform X2 [Coffea arabica]|uniref:peroxidase n=1 Tax=Coffea arabica TaxID=13443 RepID=A0ABM4WFV8_COFAR
MLALVFVLVISWVLSPFAAALSTNYYDHTCPEVESIITRVVKKAMMNDKTVPAALLRMHFHDCFIRSGGPSWNVPKGRKDGRISKATETVRLPDPTFNISQLQQSFSKRGLSLEDLVALSGGHTLGFAHCSSFQNRIHNFNSTHDVDPSLQPSFAASLRKVCPMHNKVRSAGSGLDSSAITFDNIYYKRIILGKSIFSSDEALSTATTTKALVSKFANSQEEFYTAFVKSMIKMSSISGSGKEIRLNCRVVN